MQAHNKEIHAKEYHFPNNMIMESQVSGLAKSGFGKLVNFQNFD